MSCGSSNNNDDNDESLGGCGICSEGEMDGEYLVFLGCERDLIPF